jgi:hypothetical protein
VERKLRIPFRPVFPRGELGICVRDVGRHFNGRELRFSAIEDWKD